MSFLGAELQTDKIQAFFRRAAAAAAAFGDVAPEDFMAALQIRAGSPLWLEL